MSTSVDDFLRAKDRFFCPKLSANLSIRECVSRQTRPVLRHKAHGQQLAFKIQPGVDLYCRSGMCELGQKHLVKLGVKKT